MKKTKVRETLVASWDRAVLGEILDDLKTRLGEFSFHIVNLGDMRHVA